MKILITNTVTLNGGDFAILESMIKMLKKKYGNDTEFVIYDFHADITTKYYSGLNFRQALYLNYHKEDFQKFRNRIKGLSNILIDFYNNFAIKRLMLAAKLFAKGKGRLGQLVLSNEQRIDFRHYTTADIIISTGGTYLVENYGLKERIFDYNFTLALNKPLIFFTQSLGPFKLPENINPLKAIFDKATLILLRDQASLNNLKEIGVNTSRSRICSDVVFSDTNLEILEKAKTKKLPTILKVGISVRDWSHFKYRSREEGTKKYYSSVAALCEFITTKLEGEVIFVSTCQAVQEYHVDDSVTAQKIFSLLSDKAKRKTSVNKEFHKPTELKKILKEFDLVISTRMHGAIQALNVGVPVLPIAYEFKIEELFKKIIGKDLILNIDNIEEDNSVNVLNCFLKHVHENRSKIFDKVIVEHHSAKQPIQFLKEIY